MKSSRAYWELHVAVLLFGFTAVLGSLIQLNALALVWWRVVITVISLVLLGALRGRAGGLSQVQWQQLLGIGVLVGLHWVAFYGAIKLSNASIGVLTIASITFFTALLEPLLLGQRRQWLELAWSLLLFPGIWLVVQHVDFSMWRGIAAGLLAAFLAALFTILNKKQVANIAPQTITAIELSGAGVFLTLLLLVAEGLPGQQLTFWPPRWQDWVYLLALGLGCTTLAYVLSLRALRQVSAYVANLAINLEPIYGIALAWLILPDNRTLAPGFYLGASIILFSVLGYPLLQWRLALMRRGGAEQSKPE